jgi:histidinol-phosphate aminotransferase
MIQPRKTVQMLQAYSPPLEGRRGLMRLDFNENTTGFPESYGGHEPSLMTSYPEYQELLDTLSTQWQIEQDRLLLTNGSDEGLFTTAFTFIEPNVDTAVISSPTYALIPHYLHLVQSRVVEVAVTDAFEYDVDGIEAVLRQGVKLAMFASPDNPTGAMIPEAKLRQWCRDFPETLFVIDEAYAEYAPTTALPLTDEFHNLLVTRTFSKAWGMAGLRLGVVIGHPQLVEAMRRVRSPYSVNTLAVSTACRLLQQSRAVLEQARETMQRKARVIEAVQQAGYRVVPASAPRRFANFSVRQASSFGIAPACRNWMAWCAFPLAVKPKWRTS